MQSVINASQKYFIRTVGAFKFWSFTLKFWSNAEFRGIMGIILRRWTRKAGNENMRRHFASYMPMGTPDKKKQKNLFRISSAFQL